MNILLLSRYDVAGASSRYRSFQFLPYLREHGFDLTVEPLLSDLYIERLYSNRPIPVLDVVQSFVKRILILLRREQYDLIWLEGEVFPWIPYFAESFLFRSNIPYIVDYDDAIFHRYDQHKSGIVKKLLGRKIDHVMQNAAAVIAGNNYLADRASRAGAGNIEIFPTVIDTTQYPLLPQPDNSVFTIGWIGSLSTARYLLDFKDVFQKFCRDGNARLVTVGIRNLSLDNAVHEVIQPWSEQIEVEQMKRFDIGIMPLVDSLWERGKCGHKLIKYMAAGRAVVASPVGVNKEIVEHGVNGYLAADKDEWLKSLNTLRSDKQLRENMGREGRKKTEQHYSVDAVAPRLVSLFERILSGRSSS